MMINDSPAIANTITIMALVGSGTALAAPASPLPGPAVAPKLDRHSLYCAEEPLLFRHTT
jgi:hypothetical protein